MQGYKDRYMDLATLTYNAKVYGRCQESDGWVKALALIHLFLWFVFILLRLFVPRMSDGLLICMSQGLKMDEAHNFCFVDFVQDISCRKLFISACVMSHPLTQLWTHQVGQKHWCDNRQIIQDGWRLDTQYSFLNTI